MAMPRVVSTKYGETVSAVVRDADSRPVIVLENILFIAVMKLPSMA
jgi:hypothetical protein